MKTNFTFYRSLIVALLIILLIPVNVNAQSWYNSNWANRKAITIDFTKVSAGTHTNFPILISITDANLQVKAQSTGNDILFTSSDGITKIDHEIESYTTGTGALVAWVEIPSLSSSANTVIYMYFGNADAANQQNNTGTWDASFKGVYHLNGAFADATSNANNGTNTGTIAGNGKISNGRTFDRSNGSDFIQINGLMGSPTNFTLSGWATLITADPNGAEIISLGDNCMLRYDELSADKTSGITYTATGTWTPAGSGINYAGTGWHYVVYTFNDATNSQIVYVDGVQVATGSIVPTPLYTSGGVNTFIGKHGNGSADMDFDGSIDEIRVVSSARSAGWVLTEYNNQSSPSTFYSVGSAVCQTNISQIPTSNLILNYKFNGNANDAATTNNGTLQNAPTVTTDRFNIAGSAYTFDGTSQYVSTANSYLNPTNFTTSIWFKTATAGGLLMGFGNTQTGLSSSYDRNLYMNNTGQVFFGVYNGTITTINSALSYNDNTWHLATATLSGTAGMILYIDGAQIASNANTVAENYTGYWRIGFGNTGGWPSAPTSNYFNGSLDDALVYDVALNSTQVATLYNSPDGAGNNGPVCFGSPLNLTATTLAGAAYSWTGPNSFTSSSQNPIVTYTAAFAGVYTVQVTTSGCISASAYTTVTSAATSSTILYAGTPFCKSLATGQAVTLTGTAGGAYSSTAGLTIDASTGAITPSTSTAGTYTVTYTISGGCTATASITITATPTTSVAGANQTGAATCGLTTVTLAANVPTIGTGAWSIVSGTGGTVTTPTSPTSTFSGTAGTTYTLRWTISNNPCTTSTSDVIITFNRIPTISNAGADQTGAATCGSASITLAGNSPSVGTGAWSIVSGSGGTITTPTSATSTFSGVHGTTYTLRWTISNTPCTASSDDVIITINQYTISADDQGLAGTNTWIGHMYDGTNFSSYIGKFTEPETFNESFVGSTSCFNVTSNNITRSIYTETFSVKYRMNSTKRGLYVADLGSDDGSRLTVDAVLVYNNWNAQSFTTKPRVLMNLNGASSLLYEFYENSGGNQVVFQNLTLVLANTLSTNATQSICLGNAGSAISGDIYGVLPSGITLSGTGYKWSYSTTPGGIRTNISGATTATFTPSSAAAPFNAAGTYYIYRNTVVSSTNNIAPNPYVASNESNAAIITVTTLPSATISYSGSPFCKSVATAQSVTQTGTAGGTYSSTAGLTISASTGAITPGTSTAGTYNVTYTIAAAGGCSVFTTAATITVTTAPSASFSYSGTPYCSNGGTASVSFSGSTDGTFTSTAGLTINAATGAITLGTSTAGTYTVTYTIATTGGCSIFTTTAIITVTADPSASISYSGSPYCNTTGTASVTRTGTPGGTYSSTAGLTINSSTGNITLSSSTIGTYIVTYTVAASGGCIAFTTTTTVLISAISNNQIDYINGTSGTLCSTVAEGGSATLTAPAGTVFINVAFASYGTPAGVCSSFSIGNCHATTSQAVAENYLLGNNTGTIPATNSVFGDPCSGTFKQLYVQATYTQPICSGTAPGTITGTTPTGGNAAFTYLWEQSITNSSTGFSTADGTNNAKDYTPGILTQTTWYKRTVISGGCTNVSTVIQVTVTQLPAATIAYTASPYCSDGGIANVTQTGTAGGTYTSTAGLTINASTGAITPNTSTAGTYTVTYTMAATGGCAVQTTTASVTITTLPVVTISYSGSPFCKSVGTAQSVTQTGTTGGTYTSTAGLTINASTGAITPNTSTAGTYTVTYTMAAAGGCAVQTTTASVTITTLPVATISYSGSPFCNSVATAQPVTQTGTAGGTYTSTAGLTINASTGAITPNTSTAGTYTVTYTMAATGGCAVQTTTASVTITTLPVATISYSGSPFCKSVGTSQSVTQTGTTGGVYSSTAGLTIDVTTGDIIPGTSTAGTYTVTYTMAAAGGCSAQTATASVTINAIPTATISYTGSPYMINSGTASVTFSGTTGGTYSSTAGLSLNATTGDITLSTSTPGTYTVTYTVAAAGGCSVYTTTAGITVVIATKTFTGTGNFSDAARWTGGTLPTVSENLVIDGACTVDNNAGTDNIAYGSLTIGTATGRTLNWVASGTNRLNVSNVSAGAAVSTLSMTNGGTLVIRGTWASTNLTFTPGAGTIELQSTITLPAAYTTYNNLIVNGSGITVKEGVVTTVNGNLIITTGTLNTNNFNLSVKGNWANNVSTTAFTAGTATVIFNGTTAQTIGGTFATTFTNLTIANTVSAVTLNVNTSITGNLSVTAKTFDIGVYTANRATAGGTLSLSGNTILKIGGTNTFPINFTTNTLNVTSTVEYNGTNQTVAARTYGNLTLSSASGAAVKTFAATAFAIVGNLTSTLGAGTSVNFTAAAILTITGNVTIGASTTFNGGSFAHSVAGNWINSGTFNGNTGTITFSGPGKGVSGSGIQNFNNLTVSASLITISNESISISGNLTTISSGSFIQASGGTMLMTGTAKTISGTGISIDNLTASGTVTTAASFNVTGNLSVSGSFTASTGNITMSGTSKTISGTGNKTFAGLVVSGSITTAVSFSIANSLNVNGSFSASAGTATFTGTSSLSGTANLFNTTINGTSLQLAANSILGIANTLTITAGTLNVTSSIPNTVNFNGTGAQNINAITYNNLVLSNGNLKTATGDITTNKDITIETGTTFTASSYTHSIYGNWNNYGTFVAGTSTIQFAGSATAYLTGFTTFNILSSNTSSASNELILNDNISAAIVNMTNGIITTGSDTLTITNTRTGDGRIYGNIQRIHSFTTGVAYAFESSNNSITFSAVSAVSSITVSVVKGLISDFPFGGSMGRVYNVTVPTGTYNATLRLHYEDNELNGINESSMGLWNYVGTTWNLIGKTGNDTSNNYVELSGLTNMSNRYTLSDNLNIVTWNGSVSTDWNTAANWTTTQGAPSIPPSASDIVSLGTVGFTYQPTISANISVSGIHLDNFQAVTLTLASGGSLTVSGNIDGDWTGNAIHTINVNNQTLVVNGDLILSDEINGQSVNLNIGAGTVSVLGSLFQAGDASINFSGAGILNIDNNFTYKSGTFTAGSGTVIYNGSGNQAIAQINYNNLTINKTAGIAAIDSLINVAGNFLISSGEVDNFSTVNITGNVTIAAGATLHNNYRLNVGGNWIRIGNYIGTGAYVAFNGSGTQTISSTTFNNLVINKPVGTSAELTGNVVINGNLTVTSGTLNIKSFSCDRIVAGGNLILSDSATFILGANNAPFNFTTRSLSTSSTVIADGTGSQAIFSESFGNLILRNAGVKTLVSPITVKGTLTIENGSNFDGGSQTITLNGNWVNNGTFTASTSTIIATGITKTISGNTTFNRFSVYGSYTFLSNITLDRLLIINSTGSLSAGTGIIVTMNGDLINSGILYTLGTTTFTGNVLQTLSLLNAVQTVAITVNFNGSVPPEMISTSAPQFGYLNINNTGGVNPSVGWNIAYGLTVGSGASFNGGNSTHNILGSVTNNGTITSNGIMNFIPSSAVTVNLGNDFSSTGSVVFGGTGAITLAGSSVSFNNVVISNTNATGITPVSGWDMANNFTINNGSVFNAGNRNYLIGGSIINNGTVNSGASTFTFDGTTDQTVTSMTFYNLDAMNSGGKVTLLDATVNNNLSVTTGTLSIGNNEIGRTIAINGNITVAGGTTFNVDSTSNATHLLSVSGNIINNGTLNLRPDANSLGDITFNKNGIQTIAGAGAITNFNRITTNMGLIDTNYLDVTAANFSAPNGFLTLNNGSFNLNSAGVSVTPFTADIATGNFLIPATAGLWVNAGTINSSAMNWTVAGTVKVTGGTMNMGSVIDNAVIPQSTSRFLVTAGNLNLASRISNPGVAWALNMQGGTIMVNTKGSTVAGIAPFNMDVPGCTFNVSGGTIVIRDAGGTAGQNLGYNNLANTGTGFTGGVLQAGDILTTASQTFGIKSTNPVYNLTVNSTNITAILQAPVLTVSNNVTVTLGKLDIDSLTLKIGGAISNSGTFIASRGTIEMNGVTAQTIPAAAFAGNTVKGLTINNNAGVTLGGLLNLTDVITVSKGSLAAEGYLILKSSATATARVAPITSLSSTPISGNVTAERYVPGRRKYRLITSPVTTSASTTLSAGQEALSIWGNWQNQGINTTANVGNFITGGLSADGFDTQTPNASLFTYDDVNRKYVGYTTANGKNTKYTPLKAGIAYYMFVYGDRRNTITTSNPNSTVVIAKGTLKTGDQVYGTASAIPLSGVTGRYTMLGNPFASPIDWSVLPRTNVSNTYWGWDPNLSGTGGYVTVSTIGTVTISSPYSGSTGLNQYIQSGQGFFVKTIGSSPALTIREQDKVADFNPIVFRGLTNELPLLAINLLYNSGASKILTDGVVTVFDEAFSNLVGNEDASKMINAATEMIAIANRGELLSIDARKVPQHNDTLFLNVAKLTKPVYTLQIFAKGMEGSIVQPYLQDKYLNTLQLLSVTDTNRIDFNVSLSVPASFDTNRFRILFKSAIVLPVKFISVMATKINKDILVKWEIAEESGIRDYKVERSGDGINFSSVGSVSSRGNNTVQSYEWLDRQPVAGNNYYRIRAIELAGNYFLSQTVLVKIESSGAEISVYPNPIKNKQIHLYINSKEKGQYTVKIFDLKGVQIIKQLIDHTGGSMRQVIYVNKMLPSGVYYMEVSNQNQRYIQSVMIE
ncbi:MAG: DUF2341 domain-containing protein [Ferruginibacter sp.]